MQICIAGKNKCSIEFVRFVSKIIPKKRILVLPNDSDNGKDSWQPSLKKFANKNKFKITNLKNLYKIKDLIFISIEYEKIIKPKLFTSKKLFNFHFSLLPKYRGCHTNFLQILNGEKYSGVTLHLIDRGIDTGKIIDHIKYKLSININAYDNYFKLMNCSVKLLKKNFLNILNNKYNLKKTKNSKKFYYSRSSVDYKNIKFINTLNLTKKQFNKIRALIFPPFQLPILNGKKVKNIKYNKRKYIVTYD